MGTRSIVDLSSDTSARETGRGEYARVLTLLAALLLLQVTYLFRYHVNMDEPQHLHVVWGWVHGLLQYRDVFDNHSPLFHLLCTPLFAALGERSDVLLPMRLAMIPLYGLTLWSLYTIGRVLFSPRVGLWAAVLAGFFPPFFLCSVEFRPDNLWTALWLLTLAVLIGGRLTWARSFTVGVLLGTALGVSMKTTLLLAVLSSAVLAAVLLPVPSGGRTSLAQCGPHVVAALSGLLVRSEEHTSELPSPVHIVCRLL